MAADAAGGLFGELGRSVGGLIKLGSGVGQVNRRPNPFYDPKGERGTGYNSDAFEYGGYKGGRRDYTANLNTRRNEVEGRQAFQANYDQANADRAAGQQARAGAVGMADAIAARARGETPSIAQMQADRQMGQAVAAQNAQVASARGGASVALAQQNAANNVAGAQSAISNQAQINAAQERERAEANAVGAYQGIRSGDQAAEGLAGQRQQFNTNMQQANRDANDNRAMGYENLEARANESALQAKQNEQQILAQTHMAEEARAQAQAQANANAKKSLWDDIIPSDVNAKVPLQMPGGMMVSDMVGKVPTLGLGARLPPSQPSPMATTTFDRLTPDGGSMDVLGSLKAHSDFATRYAGNAGSGPAPGGFMSDEKAKVAPRKIPMDWEENDRQDSKERKLRDPKSFHRLSDGEVKKARADAKRASEDKASKDAAAMMAAWKKSLEQGSFLSDQNTKYDTPLSSDEEAEFQAWFRKHAPKGDRGGDYDYRGAFRAGITPDKTGHWPDTYKKPNHETFSNESQYANESNAKSQGRWDAKGRFEKPSKLGLTRGPDGLGLGDPNAPRMQFSPSRGWYNPEQDQDDVRKAQLDRAMASQVEIDRADASIDRQLEEQREDDERRSRDPAVGLGRAPKGYAKMRAAQMGADEAGDTDSKYAGMAPGQEDFDRTEPKKAKSPWWVSDMATDLLGFRSDERAKKAAFQEGAAYATKQITGEDMDPWAESADEDPYEGFVAPSGPNPLPPPPTTRDPVAFERRRPVPLSRLDQFRADRQAELHEKNQRGIGPVVLDGSRFRRKRDITSFERHQPEPQNELADAARSMQGSAYAYKDGLTPPSQKPGEPNFGPMAQNMEQSPIAATAVKQDPTTGLKVIDRDKALKVTMSVAADQQRQIDRMTATMNRLQSAPRRKR